MGRRQSITHAIDGDISEPDVELLREKVLELLADAPDDERREEYSRILDHIDQEIIVDRDIEKLLEQVRSLSQREGTQWHRVLLSDLHHPRSVRSVVLAGDSMLDEPSPVLSVAELPVVGPEGRGVIDLTVFIRRVVKGRVLWTPVLVLEVKTKTSFDFNLYGLKLSRDREDHPPAFYIWKRGLTDEEWETTVTSPPPQQHMRQLEAYERALLEECQTLVPEGVRLPETLWKGVIVLDTAQEYSMVFRAFHVLLDELTTEILSEGLEARDSQSIVLSFDDDSNAPRVSAFLQMGESLEGVVKEIAPPVSVAGENQFRERVSDERLLTLYLSVPSPTSSGNAAAWIARNWHLLNHLDEVTRDSEHTTQVFWLDLLGDYPTVQLVRRRAGLDKLLKQKRIDTKSHKRLSTLLERISFIDMREVTTSVLRGSPVDVSQTLSKLESDTASDTEKVIIVDGWAELRRMLPVTQSRLLKALETQLLDVLPSRNTNVIWLDEGVPHTRMNRHYQRVCIRPLPHDSPRRFHLDEIIYNVPVSPRVFGWQSPQREDVRVIIQDTPTDTIPWRTTIHVPHLRDWARVFRGLSRRDGVVSEAEVMRSDFTRGPMYGRSVTLESIQSSLPLITSEKTDQLQDTGMTLAPSLLRSRRERDTYEVRADCDECSLQRVVVPIVSGTSVSLTDRITLATDRPPPRPSRAKREYVPLSEITRGWYYDRRPIDPNDRYYEVGVTRRPPMYQWTGLDEVDSTVTRRRELRRLKSAARYLMARLPKKSKVWACCRETAVLCAETLSGSSSEDAVLHALQQVRELLRQGPWTELWGWVEQSREGLSDVMSSGNRQVLRMAQELNPDLLSLYGNNLFLAMLAVIESLSLERTESLVTILWGSVAEWQLYQMGFRQTDSEDIARSQYDFQYIHSNLLARARRLGTRVLNQQAPSEECVFGQLVWVEHGERLDAWLVFPDSSRPLLGLMTDIRGDGLRTGWQECETDPVILRTSALSARDSSLRGQVVLSEVSGVQVLWSLTEVEGVGQWTDPVVIEYATSTEDSRLLRWVRLAAVPEALLSELEDVRPTRVPVVDSEVDTLLAGAFKRPIDIEEVTVEVRIDHEKECYRVAFSSGHVYEFQDTFAVIVFLKHPYLRGVPFRTEDGAQLFWDHREDITYEASEVDLSFLRPLVHRREFYSLGDLFPLTCSELLDMEEGDNITLVAEVHDEERRRGVFSYITVRLTGLPEHSQLRALEEERLTPYELELLAECGELVDRSIQTRFAIDINVRQLVGVRLPVRVSESSRLCQSLSHEAIEEEVILSPPEGEWELKCRTHMNKLQWSLRPPSTGEAWRDRIFELPLDATLNAEGMVCRFREELEAVGVREEQVMDYAEVLEGLRELLRVLGWGEERPPCCAEVIESRQGFRIRVTALGEGESTLVLDTEFILDEEVGDLGVVLDELYEGELGEHDIVNTEEFEDMLRSLLTSDSDDNIEVDEVDPEEAELLRVIREYREGGSFKWVAVHTNYLVEYYVQQERLTDALERVEENIDLLEGLDLDNEDIRWCLFIAKVLRVETLMSMGRREDAGEGLQRAFELVPVFTDPQSLNERRKKYFLRALEFRDMS